jgi:hypothetical protein
VLYYLEENVKVLKVGKQFREMLRARVPSYLKVAVAPN